MILAKLIEGKRLEDIPGVGARIAEKLREYFGCEEEALTAIASCKLSILSEAVGRTAAARIIHGVYRLATGAWPRDVAATDDAWKLFNEAKRVIERLIASPAARDALACLLPMPSTGVAHARRRLEIVKGLAENGIERLKAFIDSMRGFEWPKPVKVGRINRVLIVVGDPAAYKRARDSLGAILRDVVYVEDVSDVERVAREKGESIVYDPEGVYHGTLPRAKLLDVTEVAPEVVVEYFRVNWRSIEKLLDVLEEYGDIVAYVASMLGVDVKLDLILAERGTLKLFHGGELSAKADEEYGRLKNALEKLDRVVDEVEEWVNTIIQSRLESLEVKLSAAQFLKLLSLLREGGEAVELPEEIYEVFEEASRQAVEAIAGKLRLEPDEAELLEGILPRTPVFPVELDRSKVEELRAYLRSKLHSRRFELLQEIAGRLKGLRRHVEIAAAVAAAAEVFAAEAIAVLEGWACIPEVSVEYLGVGFEKGLEASLVGRPDAQPVTYVVGSTPFRPDGVKGERVIILTGANSGGKTTLLKTVCETSLLAQAGMVVYARRAWVGVFDHVYFLSKPSGMVDAGALESTLRLLASIAAAGRGRRLVLVDELEAATEAGAAARIMGVLVERLCRDVNVVAVIVSHLAREILGVVREVEGCLRVDGIEARGLDENYNLIVDRNPRFYYLARSTPELVVRRLLYKSRSRSEREFYNEVLKALESR